MAAANSEPTRDDPPRRYVILRHEVPPGSARPSHWDWLFDVGPEKPLLTWALEELPRDGATLRGFPLPPHRRQYLDYEGELSGGRGVVRKWDVGTYRLTTGTWEQLQMCLDESHGSPIAFCCRLQGTRLRGELSMARLEERDQFWTFSFRGTMAVR
jgi:hypothetical protein